MYILLLFFTILLIAVIADIGLYILKRLTKPDNRYIKELQNLQKSKVLNFISYSIAILLMIIMVVKNSSISIRLYLTLIILFFIIETTQNHHQLKYLKNKVESNGTKKYILWCFIFKITITLIALILSIFLYYNIKAL